jgi:hypothetical protein
VPAAGRCCWALLLQLLLLVLLVLLLLDQVVRLVLLVLLVLLLLLLGAAAPLPGLAAAACWRRSGHLLLMAVRGGVAPGASAGEDRRCWLADCPWT